MTLDELIDACNDALYEVNGYGEVSRRTIQHDIQEMRYSQALGYYAPITVWPATDRVLSAWSGMMCSAL